MTWRPIASEAVYVYESSLSHTTEAVLAVCAALAATWGGVAAVRNDRARRRSSPAGIVVVALILLALWAAAGYLVARA